ncbi:hypothetical protein ATN83_1630 [Raoultella ornithinolytica]|nr:hypothetical protein ATN83_1630 [Raoultella ornithinolytica]KDV92615.1 hypothetical protein AB00_3262 [Raoultella ornithinolytica 2-156-04_S1_C1]KDX13340.1 hypothetical protein AB28_3267 [Raoultella ornithinolytica 2-156-04_S1_C2]
MLMNPAINNSESAAGRAGRCAFIPPPRRNSAVRGVANYA